MQPRSPDAAIAALAGHQHGIVSRAQLAALGLGRRAIEHRLELGRLQRVHRGVYAVGHRVLSREGHWIAAVLAAGPGAVVSHRSAAALWELRPAVEGPVTVTTPRALRPQSGIEVRRTALAGDECTSWRGIPTTAPARTLLDLAATLPRHELERAVEAGERLRLADTASLDELLSRHPRRKGVRQLRAILDSGRAARLTRSDLEARFLRFLDRHDLPIPAVNARVRAGGRRLEVDAIWPVARLAVELDGHAYHATRAAFERDRERDRLLQAAGWRVVRITWRQLRDEPEAVARDIRALTVAVNPDIRG